MSKRSWGVGAVALISAVALTLSGCASTGESDTATPSIITTNGTEPLYPLITFGITDSGGGKVISSLYAGLVSFNSDGSISNEVAESIESDDAKLWTVKLKEGWTFTNGEAITAQTFVDTWSNAAKDPVGASWFTNVEGVSEDGSTDATGLAVVDELTFTIQLNETEADFPLRLGYNAYMPLPSTAFEDIEAFGQNPVGNGPYMFDGEDAWLHDQSISLVTNPDYEGNRTPVNDGLKFSFYTDLAAAYADAQSNNLDILDTVPDTAFSSFQEEFADRYVNQPAAIYQGFNIPYYIDGFKEGEEGDLRRAAISMSIDRDEIAEILFQGTRTSATDFTSPVLDGWSDQLAGSEVLDFNPEEANKLWEEAESINPYAGPFTIAYNSDGGHQAWVDAVSHSIANTLGIEAAGQPFPTFAASLEPRTTGTLTGATRAAWQADYPTLANFLAPVYLTDGPYNFEGYSNPEFDETLHAASAASSIEENIELNNKAQEILMKDLPAIPLWYQNAVGVWSEGLENVEFGWDSVPLYHQVKK